MAQQLTELVEHFCNFQRKQRGKTEGGVKTYQWILEQFVIFEHHAGAPVDPVELLRLAGEAWGAHRQPGRHARAASASLRAPHAGSWVIELRDHVGNRFGIGSKIIIHYGAGGARHQMREIQASGGFLSFDASIAYFGLGEFPRVERVEVMWSTGERSELRGDFAAGARYILHRPPGGGPPPAATASIQRRVGATRSP
jgi:hypothetical protein